MLNKKIEKKFEQGLIHSEIYCGLDAGGGSFEIPSSESAQMRVDLNQYPALGDIDTDLFISFSKAYMLLSKLIELTEEDGAYSDEMTGKLCQLKSLLIQYAKIGIELYHKPNLDRLSKNIENLFDTIEAKKMTDNKDELKDLNRVEQKIMQLVLTEMDAMTGIDEMDVSKTLLYLKRLYNVEQGAG